MTQRKKLLLSLAAVLLVAMIAGYIVASSLFDQATRKVMAQVIQVADQQGLELAEPSFESAHLSPLLSAHWYGLRAKIRLPEGADSQSDRMWNVYVNHMKVRKGLSESSVVEIDRVTITTDGGAAQAFDALDSSQRAIELERIVCHCPLSLFDPGKSLRTVLPEVVRLLTATEFNMPLELNGSLSFSLNDDPVKIGIEVQQTDDTYALRLTPADVAKLSQRFDEQLTEAEVQLLADYPLRAARLLEIKDAAESDSRRARERDESIPEDAFRHVLWSYLLAKTYGEEFAKRVGDAHEQGDTGNTPAEREMDYHNNAIGRAYAANKFPRTALLKRMLQDPEVRRQP
ncbi:MAG: hypothetical protein AAGD11_13730 [Planctomycetota bacterium]